MLIKATNLQNKRRTQNKKMVFTESMAEFTQNIRDQKARLFWLETARYQKFSPEASQDASDLVSSVPPGTFDDADETPEPYTCYGKDPYHGSHKAKFKCDSDEQAIEYAKENGYQLINTCTNGSMYYFKCPLDGGKTYEDIIEYIESRPAKLRKSIKSIVIKVD